jgi:hypothetical protein
MSSYKDTGLSPGTQRTYTLINIAILFYFFIFRVFSNCICSYEMISQAIAQLYASRDIMFRNLSYEFIICLSSPAETIYHQ